MKPPAIVSFGDMWSTNELTVDIDVLMPNGILISLHVDKELTLLELKEDAFEEAEKQPLFGALRDKQNYTLTCNSLHSTTFEELNDEELRLCDVCPFLGLFRLIEKQSDKAAKQLDDQIGFLIGKSLAEFDKLKNPEVNDFRWKMRNYCEQIVQEREEKSFIDKLKYQHPVSVVKTDLPEFLKSRLPDGNLRTKLRFDTGLSCYTLSIPHTHTPSQLLDTIICKNPEAFAPANAYLLKVCGRQEYLIGSHALSQFKCIREMLSNDEMPFLIAILKSNIESKHDTLAKFLCALSILRSYVEEEESLYSMLQNEDTVRLRSGSVVSLSGTGTTRRRPPAPISSWTVQQRLILSIDSGCRINCPDLSRVRIEVGLFHGGDLLTSAESSEAIVVEGDGSWQYELVFEINVCDVPRMARFCFALYYQKPTKKTTKTQISLAWANTTVFDFRGLLKSGSITLSMWPYSQDLNDKMQLLNPLGTVVPNPTVDTATCLTITFGKYVESDHPIVYPSLEDIMKSVAMHETILEDDSESAKKVQASKHYLEQVKEICDRDQLHEMHEQEKELLWFLRDDCRLAMPHSLSKLLMSVKWHNHRDVAQTIALLQSWPKINPEFALELLDYAYADNTVRKFAIDCLRDVPDDDILLYLLQLVQALKYESYLYCDLARFLLERALNNQRIGHYFFWLLRSEMHLPSSTAVAVYFGLILEAYCRGATEHMQVLSRQQDALAKMKRVNEIIKDSTEKTKEAKIAMMHETLRQKYYQDALGKVISPLDPSLKMGYMRIQKCRFMDSKMKPLWLVFENDDSEARDTYLIFKNGDDLRQDMLTLQMIRIMDKLWKDEGLDLRMTPYRCISTDHNLGLIEVVLNANTIANIQKEKGSTAFGAFKKGSLLEWLRDSNPDEISLREAVRQFTLSCAGYCVATYVLGIADRHNDNIMIKKNGQLFHIDFGHILGNFKEKFNIRRERVPFVLTNDFVHVITHGQEGKSRDRKSQDFSRFQHYCEQAFTILRRKGSFIISLFAMMLTSGFPELTSVDDLDYLRETLVLDLNEEQAIQHFRSKFYEALRNSWKTSLNWCAHNIAKDNRLTI